MRIRRKTRSMIKEAFDNLPGGVCFFNEAGVPVLVNRTMYRLVFMLTKRDLQSLSDLEEVLKNGEKVFPGDGSVWRFEKRVIGERGEFTEIIAADMSELYRSKRELENANREQSEMMKRLENVGRNVVSITRNEEILAMKMRVHNELGYAIGATRRFMKREFSDEEKAEYISNQRRVAKMLLDEIGNDDEPDIFAELKKSAEQLGTEVVLDKEFPASVKEIMTKAVLECLINTVRHAGGDKVFVKTSRDNGSFTAVITNNGSLPHIPEGSVTEGGGLSSLRKKVENADGSMLIRSEPEFSVTITLPDKEESNYD